jgi:RIO-like serine/threonine protein kinase
MTATPDPALRREDLARAEGTLGKRRWYRPVVHLVALPGGTKAVVKDFLPCPWWWRATWGRHLVEREVRAYGRLGGVAGIPRFLGRVDPWAFAVEWVPGRDLGKCPRGSLRVETFDRLAATVEEMHRRGVVHLDLRQRRNVLVDGAGVPRVIDFSAAMVLRPGGWRMRRLAPVDASGVLKYKRRFLPDSLTDDERARLRRVERWRRWWPFS